MKRLRCMSLLMTLILLFSLVSMSSVGAVGEWANVKISQRRVDHWSGCTVCSIQLMFQNSDTLKSEWQFPAGLVPCSNYGKGDLYDKFNQLCTDNIASGTGVNKDKRKCPACGYVYSGKTHVSDAVWPARINTLANKACKDGITWSFLGSENSVEGQSTERRGSNYVVGVGGKDFKNMTYSETVSAMKLFWNAGYWVAIGLVYKSGGTQQGPGPTGYTSDHWVMLCGVDDSNFYINDPGDGTVNTFASHENYKCIVHLALFKNSYKSPLELSGGQRANLTPGDYSNLEDAGITPTDAENMMTTGYQNRLSMSWSDDVLLGHMRLTEINLDDLFSGANLVDLRQNDLEVVESWRTNIEMEKKTLDWIQILRWIVVFVGMMFIIWATLVYLAYWFDHINSFIYLDLLHLITFGQLHICPPDQKPTFKLGKDVKDKTVSHFQIVCICLTAIAFGVLLVSGRFYLLVQALVNKIIEVIHMM